MIWQARYAVIIPAHNEENYIASMLESLASQTLLPIQAIVVDDNSIDNTAATAEALSEKYQWLKVVRNVSEARNVPGSKVILAFQKGFQQLTADYDFIVKLDADLILPAYYFETISQVFLSDEKAGMAGGFAYIEKNGKWVLEKLTDNDHIRGAFKAYRKQCFENIGGLKPAMGWDTVDELLAKYHGWKVVTVPGLMVKHLKPTGAVYDTSARFKQGEAFYALGYGFVLTCIASLKLAAMKKKPALFIDYIRGFLQSKSGRKPLLVNSHEAKFIRSYRWKKIRQKIF